MTRNLFLSSVAHRAFAPLCISVDGVGDAISDAIEEAVEEAAEEIREELAEVQDEIEEAISDAVEEITEAVEEAAEETATEEQEEKAAWHGDLEELKNSILPRLESLTASVEHLAASIPPPPLPRELTEEAEAPPLNPETATEPDVSEVAPEVQKMVREIIVI